METPNWTIDGIDFIPACAVFPEAGKEDENRLIDWCEANGAVFYSWNSAVEVSPCYSDAALLAHSKKLTKVVILGYHEPDERIPTR